MLYTEGKFNYTNMRQYRRQSKFNLSPVFFEKFAEYIFCFSGKNKNTCNIPRRGI